MRKYTKALRSGLALMLIILLTLSLCACGMVAEGQSATPSAGDTTAEAPTTTPNATASSATPGAASVQSKADAGDKDASYNAENAVTITLSGDTASVSGLGATVEGSTVSIQQEGTYILTGTLTNGQLLVNAGEKDDVRLVLSGAHITNANSAAIWAKAADTLTVTLAEGSENTLESASLTLNNDGEPSAALFAACDLTLNGAGRLTVTAAQGNGIGTKDDLVVTGGVYAVTAAEGDALRGRDSISITDGNFTLQAGDDGMQANNDESADKGFIVLDGGSFRIEAACDGIQAETSLVVNGGSYQLTTGGGSANASTTDTGGLNEGWGRWGFDRNGEQATATDDEATASAKGLKAGVSLLIAGGNFSLDTSDDALHSNGDLTFAGGTLTLTSGDDGLHADGTTTVSGGTLRIEKAYEGIEGAQVFLTGGDTYVVARDDGLNAAGGSDGETTRPGFGGFNETGKSHIVVSGGVLQINAEGDGLDANGAIYLQGGETYVSGPTNMGNGALDSYNGVVVTGGLLAAAGSMGMAELPEDSSTQGVWALTLEGKAGQPLVLTDANGETLLSFTPEKAYQHLVLSAPGLKVGETYALSIGGETAAEATLTQTVTGEGGAGGFGGGGWGGGSGGKRPEGDVPPEKPDDLTPPNEKPIP